ncbi:MAG TPA: DNA-directed RNA polymerase subunit alpha [Candidatus Peribacterales bacterium]|nr:DNA-directed RNA polymerase subunit alpha [Candidatus Peribacterales bacterium]
MHIIQEEIGPPKISASTPTGGTPVGDETHLIFTISPLPPGYGMTLGNTLRRVLYSSLPGAAVSSMRIDSVSHEYSTLKGVVESALDIGLNIRQLHLRKFHKDPETVTLEGKGPMVLTAKDLQVSSDIEVLNPDLPLVTLEKGGSIKLQMTVEKGVGFLPASERNRTQSEPGLIFLDAVFSPVARVKYDIVQTRVGQRTNLDELRLEIETNGSLSAREAMKFSAQLLTSYFNYFSLDEEQIEKEFLANFQRSTAAVVTEETQHQIKQTYTPIEILNLSPRTLNALINGGIGSIEQLTKCSKASLTNLRGFGSKALDEVEQVLNERGHSLLDDASAPTA